MYKKAKHSYMITVFHSLHARVEPPGKEIWSPQSFPLTFLSSLFSGQLANKNQFDVSNNVTQTQNVTLAPCQRVRAMDDVNQQVNTCFKLQMKTVDQFCIYSKIINKPEQLLFIINFEHTLDHIQPISPLGTRRTINIHTRSVDDLNVF